MTMMKEVFVIKESGRPVKFSDLSLRQRAGLEMAIQSDRAAMNFGTDLYSLSYEPGGKLVARFNMQTDDHNAVAAANDGVLPMNLMWDAKAVDQHTGQKGAWVEEKQ